MPVIAVGASTNARPLDQRPARLILDMFGYEDQTFGWSDVCDGPLPGLA